MSNLEYWRGRYEDTQASGSSYSTMICWDEKRVQEETEKLAPYIMNVIGVSDAVLDYGCGFGRFSYLFEKSSYIGIDILPEVIEQCRKLNPERTFELPEDAQLEKRKFDFCLLFTALQHMDPEEKKSFLSEARKNCSSILIVDTSKEQNSTNFFFTQQQLSELYAQTGWKVRLSYRVIIGEDYHFVILDRTT